MGAETWLTVVLNSWGVTVGSLIVVGFFGIVGEALVHKIKSRE